MANHEAAIQSLTDTRNHWFSRILAIETQIDAHKENLNRLRDEAVAAVDKLGEIDRSIETLKNAR